MQHDYHNFTFQVCTYFTAFFLIQDLIKNFKQHQVTIVLISCILDVPGLFYLSWHWPFEESRLVVYQQVPNVNLNLSDLVKFKLFFSFGQMPLAQWSQCLFLTVPPFQIHVRRFWALRTFRPRCVWQGHVFISAPDLQLSDAGQWQQEEARGPGK
jgi:hypothetical protein